ncbi:MAG: UbiA prenyltransferase family [Thermoplasmata archaeon]|nr:UbiA prenyltransferase family [Thermoplasmata archaeon]
MRAILVGHLARASRDDPNALLPAARFAEAAAGRGDAALRDAAADYVRLWARTFKTLVRHLRGRPERAISLFAAEVYPFLRGDRLAARVEAASPGQARLRLLQDLPDAYTAGLLEAFVGLSGAEVHAKPLGGGLWEVHHRVAAADRLAHFMEAVASARWHLVSATLLACSLGLALAWSLGAAVEPWRAGAIVAGAVAAQIGANALHDLRHAHPAGPLAVRVADRRLLRRQAMAGYGLATLLGALLAVAAPAVVLFAAAGLALSLSFGALRNHGWGPAVVAAIYGPLMVGGALHAAAPELGLRLELVPVTLPVGVLAAATLYVDDLADRPLDEAGGQRTLLVRLPRRRHVAGFAALALGAAALAAWILAARAPPLMWAAAPLAVAAAALVALVRRHADDPHGLAPARLGTQALHAATALLLVAAEAVA